MLAASLCNIQIPWGGWQEPRGNAGRVEQEIVDRIRKLGRAKKAKKREEIAPVVIEAANELSSISLQLAEATGQRVEFEPLDVADLRQSANDADLRLSILRLEFIYIAFLRILDNDEDDIEAILLCL